MVKSEEAIEIVKKFNQEGMSVYRISKEIGVSWITVKRWFEGIHKPSYAACVAIEALEKDEKS